MTIVFEKRKVNLLKEQRLSCSSLIFSSNKFWPGTRPVLASLVDALLARHAIFSSLGRKDCVTSQKSVRHVRQGKPFKTLGNLTLLNIRYYT